MVSKTQEFKLRMSYVNADNLYEWVGDNFKNFDCWRNYEEKNRDQINLWEDERLFRIVEGAKSGLINEVLKGNASAVSQLKSLLGFGRPVGRPKGTTNLGDEHKAAIELKVTEDYSADIERLAK
ncbi:hypothetical protein [Litorilituus sediminis]|uniref:Uncharacterized protein n=1 Tax=Litorilituus sediminis TaxID=718192 RepID=A0A4P6P0I0_9GAMM|nr:hypothetical protein [Litorilituus sediminis]QBG34383.1 hypothetical protein EMK97_00830 [Litorilituus sediminis]